MLGDGNWRYDHQQVR